MSIFAPKSHIPLTQKGDAPSSEYLRFFFDITVAANAILQDLSIYALQADLDDAVADIAAAQAAITALQTSVNALSLSLSTAQSDIDALEALQPLYAKLAGGNSFTGAQTVAFQSLTDAGTIDTDASLSNHFYVTLGGNRTLANPTNMRDGGIYNWRIKQDGTGSRTLAFGSKFKFSGSSTVSTSAGAVDRIVGQYFAADDQIECVLSTGFA